MSQRTIAAVATPAGNGALGIIRISGTQALNIGDNVFKSANSDKLSTSEGYRGYYGKIYNGETVLDDVVALVFRAPHSFTGEDTVEFSCHGGTLMLNSILRVILQNGAVMAKPGEFTERAFLNGKTDLTKAESIMGLISSQSEAELKISRSAHNGKIFEKIAEIEKRLVSVDAAISVYSDYPDEELEELEPERFEKMLIDIACDLEKLIKNYDAGKVISRGIDTVIVGKPNVGKSTVMNMMSQSERSIVTDVAGTTRDIIEETVMAGDILLRLADTAGIHATDDKVESIGVDLAQKRLETAQLVLAVFDCSSKLDLEDTRIIKNLNPENTVIILNKSDLGENLLTKEFKGFKCVETSAKISQGYDEICNAIKEISGIAHLDSNSVVLINERQRDCALKAFEGVTEALNSLKSGCTIDAVGVCVDDAIAALFELTGKRVTNDVTDEIFRRFCVGK